MSASFIPPQNFGMVEHDLFRSGQPNELNFPFLEKLRLRTVIYLAPDELPAPVLTWLEDQQIDLIHLGDDVGRRSPWKPASEETVLEGLRILLDPSAYPLLVMCSLGRHRTGTIVGCLRKLQGWNLTSILEEYRRHAGTKFRQLNEQFIGAFVQLSPICSQPKSYPRLLHSFPQSSLTRISCRCLSVGRNGSSPSRRMQQPYKSSTVVGRSNRP